MSAFSGEIDPNEPLSTADKICVTLLFAVVVAGLAACCCGCAYRGGKVVDGTNLAIGITVPGTEWTINALDYVGGLRVAGNDMTRITVSNEVHETNSYFGVVSTSRSSRVSTTIQPCETASGNAPEGAQGGATQGGANGE